MELTCVQLIVNLFKIKYFAGFCALFGKYRLLTFEVKSVRIIRMEENQLCTLNGDKLVLWFGI